MSLPNSVANLTQITVHNFKCLISVPVNSLLFLTVEAAYRKQKYVAMLDPTSVIFAPDLLYDNAAVWQ